MKKLVCSVLLLPLPICLAGPESKEKPKKPEKEIPKAELAIRAGTNIHKVFPEAAKQGESPRFYGSPGKATGNPHEGPPPYGRAKGNPHVNPDKKGGKPDKKP